MNILLWWWGRSDTQAVRDCFQAIHTLSGPSRACLVDVVKDAKALPARLLPVHQPQTAARLLKDGKRNMLGLRETKVTGSQWSMVNGCIHAMLRYYSGLAQIIYAIKAAAVQYLVCGNGGRGREEREGQSHPWVLGHEMDTRFGATLNLWSDCENAVLQVSFTRGRWSCVRRLWMEYYCKGLYVRLKMRPLLMGLSPNLCVPAPWSPI